MHFQWGGPTAVMWNLCSMSGREVPRRRRETRAEGKWSPAGISRNGGREPSGKVSRQEDCAAAVVGSQVKREKKKKKSELVFHNQWQVGKFFEVSKFTTGESTPLVAVRFVLEESSFL